MKILVAIANHGVKNCAFLEVVLASYRTMPYEVDIVVLSDAPKDLGPDVEVLVGAPTKDPWSLPFRHRQLFADRAADYALFIYSEDDTLIEHRHIRAFLEVNELLPEDEVPGFQRFEVRPSGERSYCSVHSAFRWLPGSVSMHGTEVFADHTNLHAACFLLTQKQLGRALASGGFLVPPHRGEFDMLVSAATDPYSRCGLRRRICVSRIDDFLIHHLPNVYLDRLGIDQAEFDAQIATLLAIARGERSDAELLHPGSKLRSFRWDVPQYPVPPLRLAQFMPHTIRRPLSIGTTSGSVERAVFPDADRIVAVPIDEVIASSARRRGLEVLEPSLEDLELSAPSRGYDAILLHQTVQHFPSPLAVLRRLRSVAAPDCVVAIVAHNATYRRLRELRRRGSVTAIPRSGFDEDGVHRTDARFLRQLAARGGIRIDAWGGDVSRRFDPLVRIAPQLAPKFLADPIFIVGRFMASPEKDEPRVPTDAGEL
jgi:SAM-dependent methyltransferase